HYGMLAVDPNCTIVESFDMNELANSVYTLNFNIKPNNKAIDHLKLNEIEKHKAEIWLLSPPCQPFTRGGKYLDDLDPRTNSLIHLMEILKELDHKPEFLFLENVYNFESSNTRKKLIKLLFGLGYNIKEYLVSPIQLGVPNDRLRYYLIANRDIDFNFQDEKIEQYCIAEGKKACINQFSLKSYQFANKILHENIKAQKISADSTFTLDNFLENPDSDNLKEMKVSLDRIKKRNNFNFDLVDNSSLKSTTFTKAYGSKHIIGSGSFLVTDTNADINQAMEQLQLSNLSDADKLDIVESLKLRFFSPLEVARLMCFPVIGGVTNTKFNISEAGTRLKFPSDLSVRQQHQLLGNSVNILVVAALLFELFN
ncbi:hypothetical protein BB561_006736, partial [Smittium simulii]